MEGKQGRIHFWKQCFEIPKFLKMLDLLRNCKRKWCEKWWIYILLCLLVEVKMKTWEVNGSLSIKLFLC